MRFRTTLQLHGKTATGIEVPADVVESFGAGRKPPVRVTIGEHGYRSTDIELDTEPREVEVAPDLARALEAEPAAKQFFDGLTHSQKQAFVVPIEQAKQAETRQRRIDKTLDALRAEPKR